MDENQTRALILFIGAGVKVLSARLVLLVVVAMAFGLWCWAMFMDDQLRIISATLFTVLVFLPVLRADMRQNEKDVPKGE
jgi:hypothetical protein